MRMLEERNDLTSQVLQFVVHIPMLSSARPGPGPGGFRVRIFRKALRAGGYFEQEGGSYERVCG